MENGAGVCRPIYIGQLYDAASNLNYLNARYQDPSRGQFLSEDPVFLGNPSQQNLTDPQSFNAYSYAEDNPIVRSDPTGRFAPLLIEAALIGLEAYDYYSNGSNIYNTVQTNLVSPQNYSASQRQASLDKTAFGLITFGLGKGLSAAKLSGGTELLYGAAVTGVDEAHGAAIDLLSSNKKNIYNSQQQLTNFNSSPTFVTNQNVLPSYLQNSNQTTSRSTTSGTNYQSSYSSGPSIQSLQIQVLQLQIQVLQLKISQQNSHH